MSSDLTPQVRRRRTFAIISHPDAGKTTLTEKFLLYSGAVQEAERGSLPSKPISPTRLPGPSTLTVAGSVRLTVMLSTTTSPSSSKTMKPVLSASPSVMKVTPAGTFSGRM